MNLRAWLFTSMILGSGCLVAQVAACGGDDASATSGDDAGGTDATLDGSGDGEQADTFVPDVQTDSRSPEQTGSACQTAAQCYAGFPDGGLLGTPVCLDRVTDGYCTHTCDADTDCCATPGECKTSLKQVCAPFESTTQKYCFLSCETADIVDGGLDAADPNAYCETQANPEFGCRSTGGGSSNRKVCVPNPPSDGGRDGASDAGADAMDAANDG